MEKEKKQEFTFANGEISGAFKVGITLEGVVHKDFVLREASVEDILAVEDDAPVSKPLNFSTQLLLRQLVRIGTFKGPFTLKMLLRKPEGLKPVDWRILRAAQGELDDMGEDESSGGEAS